MSTTFADIISFKIGNSIEQALIKLEKLDPYWDDEVSNFEMLDWVIESSEGFVTQKETNIDGVKSNLLF